jgi:hypothetical protein
MKYFSSMLYPSDHAYVCLFLTNWSPNLGIDSPMSGRRFWISWNPDGYVICRIEFCDMPDFEWITALDPNFGWCMTARRVLLFASGRPFGLIHETKMHQSFYTTHRYFPQLCVNQRAQHFLIIDNFRSGIKLLKSVIYGHSTVFSQRFYF